LISLCGASLVVQATKRVPQSTVDRALSGEVLESNRLIDIARARGCATRLSGRVAERLEGAGLVAGNHPQDGGPNL
jgi:hypothetical protein